MFSKVDFYPLLLIEICEEEKWKICSKPLLTITGVAKSLFLNQQIVANIIPKILS